MAQPLAPYGRRIGFRRHLRPHRTAGGTTYLLAEDSVTALAGPCAEPLLGLLDGSRDLAAVVNDAPAELTTQQVAVAVRQLAVEGLLTFHADNESADPAALAYWDAAGLHGSLALEQLAGTRVAVSAVEGLDASRIVQAMRDASIPVHEGLEPGPPADLTIVVCPDYLCPELSVVDDAHRRSGRPWLITKPIGTQIWIGPIFTPGDGACWRCLADRLAVHRRAHSHLRGLPGLGAAGAAVPVSLPAVSASAAHATALEAVKWLAGHRYDGQRCVWTEDTLTLRTRHHQVQRRPQCPSCGDPALMREQAKRPVQLTSRLKQLGTRGGHRCESPESTFARYRHLIGPVTGVVDDIVRDERGPQLFNSFRSGPNLALGSRSLDGLRNVLRSHSGGKGVTAAEAQVGALCEALERFSSSYHGDECRVSGSFRSLQPRAIHPNDCQLFDARQVATRTAWNATHGPTLQVPEPFGDDDVIDWTPVWSMSRQEHRLLPTSMLYFGAPGPVPSDSNGNAAGSSREDAILQGLLELIERDAVAIWWYNRARLPEFDLDDLADPWVDDLRQTYAQLGREVWVLDVTTDLGVPAMAALSPRTAGSTERIMFGFGAHLDPAVAVRRALTELNQAMPFVVTEQQDCPDPDLAHWLHNMTVENQPYLAPDRAVRPIRQADFGYRAQPDLAKDVRSVTAILESAGLEVLVLDLTRPDIGLPVVKTIVPGLRPWWARYAPGRLFDVPAQLGRQARPTPFDELNPVPLFA